MRRKVFFKTQILNMQFLAWRNVVLRMLQKFQKTMPLIEAGFVFKMEKVVFLML